MTRKTTVLQILVAALYCNSAAGQATTLLIELQNVVEYQVDADPSKIGTSPNFTPGSFTAAACLGRPIIALGDVVAVNGRPAKGTYVSRGTALCTKPTPIPANR